MRVTSLGLGAWTVPQKLQTGRKWLPVQPPRPPVTLWQGRDGEESKEEAASCFTRSLPQSPVLSAQAPLWAEFTRALPWETGGPPDTWGMERSQAKSCVQERDTQRSPPPSTDQTPNTGAPRGLVKVLIQGQGLGL